MELRKKYIRRILKIALIFLGILAMIYGVLWLPATQNFIKNKVISSLTEVWQADLHIGDVKMIPFRRIVLKDVVLMDQLSDTLLKSDRILLDYRFVPLLKRKIHLSRISLNNSGLRIYQLPDRESFNYDFLFAENSSDSTASSNNKPWKIGIGSINLENFHWHFQEANRLNVAGNIDRFRTLIREFNPEENTVRLGQLSVAGSEWKIDSDRKNDLADSLSSILAFPFTGWDIRAGRLTIDDNQTTILFRHSEDSLQQEEKRYEIITETCNIRDFQWNNQLLSAKINRIKAREKESLAIEDFRASVDITPQSISVENLKLQTASSRVEIEALLNFHNWDDLSRFPDAVDFRVSSGQSYLAASDWSVLSPILDELNLFSQEPDIAFTGQLHKSGKDYEATSLEIGLGNGTKLHVDGGATKMENNQFMFRDLRIHELSTTATEAKNWISDESLFPYLDALELVQLKARIRGNLDRLQIDQAEIQSPAIQFTQTALNLKNLHGPDPVHVAIITPGTTLNLPKISALLPDSIRYLTESFDQVRFIGKAEGNTKTAFLDGQIELDENQADLSGSIEIPIANDWREFLQRVQLDIELRKLLATPGLSKIFVPDSLDSLVDSLGFIIATGKIYSDTSQIALNAGVLTTRGNIDLQAILEMGEELSLPHYEADINLHDFGLYLPNTGLFEQVAGRINLSGQGFNKDDFALEWHTQIDQLFWNGNPFSAFTLSGWLESGILNLTGNIHDGDLIAQMESTVNFEESNEGIAFKIISDSLNLYRIGLSSKPMIFKGNAIASTRGIELDELEGTFTLNQWSLSGDTLKVSGDDLQIQSQLLNPDTRKLSLSSEYFNLALEGNYQLNALPFAVSEYISRHFRIPFPNKDTLSAFARTYPPQDFIFRLEGSRMAELLQLFDSRLEKLGMVRINGSFQSSVPALELAVQSHDLSFAGQSVDSLSIRLKGNGDSLRQYAQLHNFGLNKLQIPEMVISMDLSDQELVFGLNLQGKEDNEQLALAGSIIADEAAYLMHLDPAFNLNGRQWSINENHWLQYSDKKILVQDLRLTHGDQSISISTGQSHSPKGGDPIFLAFDNYRIGEIVRWVDPYQINPTGIVNGTMEIHQIHRDPYFKGQLEVGQLALRDQELGLLKLSAENAGTPDRIQIAGSLNGHSNLLDLSGYYSRVSHEWNLRLDADSLELGILGMMTEEYVDNLAGNVSGMIHVEGRYPNLLTTGTFLANQVAGTVKYSNTPITIPEINLQVSDAAIEFEPFIVMDAQNRESEITGRINHEKFDNFHFDLNFQSDEFQFLNTEAKDNEIIYGSLVTQASIRMTGPLDRIRLNVNAKTAVGTMLTLKNNRQSGSRATGQSVFFMHPDEWNEDGELFKQVSISNPYQFDVFANLEITPDAWLTLIIDPGSGDELLCRGNAHLTARMDSKGNLDLSGNYTFTEGKYKFNYEGLVKREFDIEEGSSLIFPGGSNEYRLSLTASYRLKTNAYTLIQNQTSLTEVERTEANEQEEFLVQLNILGTINEPQMNFQIQAPAAEQGRVGNAVSRRLAQLNNNPDELNRQVFGLLFFNSFVSDHQIATSETLARSAETVAFASLRSMVTNQLNNLANQYLQGFEVNFNIDTYSSGAVENAPGLVTELGVSVSKRLFNDRLKVQVGSNVNLSRENVAFWSNTAFSSVAGDFVIEYRLNERGNYLVRVFHLKDYNIIEDDSNYKTGVGFVIRKKLKEKQNSKSNQ